MRLLTVNIRRVPRFKRDLRLFSAEWKRPFEVRMAARNRLHDRYVIDDGTVLLFGASLNGLGLKQSFIVDLGKGFRSSILTSFESEWVRGTELHSANLNRAS